MVPSVFFTHLMPYFSSPQIMALNMFIIEHTKVKNPDENPDITDNHHSDNHQDDNPDNDPDKYRTLAQNSALQVKTQSRLNKKFLR